MSAIFHSAVARPAADRPAYLSAACRDDPSLLAEVGRLLQAHEGAGSFLESPVVETALTGSRVDRAPQRAPEAGREGQVVSHYRLEERLGAGGMGVVYLARDLALGRPAALKILPDAFTPSLRDRLRAEADACARLQHPAIATYYESGESEGTAYIAMELVRGRTLRERLRDGALPLEQAIAITECLLEALSHAHAAGILHRDIKPENIIVIGERTAKLLDFGLATLLLAAGGDAETRASLTGQGIVGTVGYMSPEQIRNEPLDVRSDLFQVGAVLYEMVTGVAAFPGVTVAERLAAVLTRDPAPLDGPAGLSTLLARTLARDPARRHPSAGALLSDLRAISGGQWSANLPDTLAVLDFHNAGGVPDDEWIGCGLAESIGDALGRTPGLTIMPRGKVLQARTSLRATDVETAAVELGLALSCRWVLAGSYRRLGPALRLTTLLVEVSTARQVASEQIDGTVDQIFSIEDRVVAATCASLAVTRASQAVVARTSLSAYECYARGRQLSARYDRGAFDQARALFEDAVRLDPGHAQALAGLARNSALRYAFTSDPSVLETALVYARRAIDADPALADAYIWLGYALYRLGHHDEAQAAWERCRELSPREMFGFYFSAGGERWVRDPMRSTRLLQRAVELDPHYGLAWWGLGTIHLHLGRHPEAWSCFDRCARLSSIPNAVTVPGVEGYWAESLRRAGRLDEARGKCLAGLDAVEQTDFMYRDTNRVFCLVTLGRTATDQADVEAARAAFHQAIAHIKGRPRTLAGGTLLVRALAGLARATGDVDAYDEACARHSSRDGFDFSWLIMCDDFLACLDLADAARALGRHDHAGAFRARARDAGAPAVTV